MRKRLFLVPFASILIFLSLDLRSSHAQFTAGADLLFGAEEDFGMNLSSLYNLRENIAVGAGAVWWPRSAPEGARYLLTELNAELRIIPYSAGRFSVHLSGITGYHYAGVRIESLGDTYRSTEHMTAIGGGAGVSYDFGAFSLTGGARHFITGFNQISAGLGVKIQL